MWARLARHADELLLILGFLGLLFLTARTLDNFNKKAGAQPTQELRLAGPDLIAFYTLNAGMNQPAVLDLTGAVLVEFSAWNSAVAVDGVRMDLWSHAASIELDRASSRAYVAWSSVPLRDSDPRFVRLRRYQVVQTLKLVKGGRAVVEYSIVPNERTDVVQLELGLYKWYFAHLRVGEQMYEYLSGDLSREQMDAGQVPRRWIPVRLELAKAPVSVNIKEAPRGPYAIWATFEVRSPKPFERTPLAIIWVERRDIAQQRGLNR